MRRKIEASNGDKSAYKPDDWLKENQHAKTVTKSNIKIDSKIIQSVIGSGSNDDDDGTDELPTEAAEFMKLSIHVFHRRIVAPFKLNTIMRVDDSLEITARYFEAMTEFVETIIKVNKLSASAICPYQVDCCIVYNNALDTAIETEIDDGKDDDDDSEDDEETGQGNGEKKNKKDDERNIDCIGDIEKKLNVNNLRYVKKSLAIDTQNFDYMRTRHFRDLLNQFREKISDQNYPHQKRFMIMIDRRGAPNKDVDDMYLYEGMFLYSH